MAGSRASFETLGKGTAVLLLVPSARKTACPKEGLLQLDSQLDSQNEETPRAEFTGQPQSKHFILQRHNHAIIIN